MLKERGYSPKKIMTLMKETMMYNLVEEITDQLRYKDKNPEDVSHVEHRHGWCTWDEFLSTLRHQTVAYKYVTHPEFRVVGKTGWWISRESWSNWSFHSPSVKPPSHAIPTTQDVIKSLLDPTPPLTAFMSLPIIHQATDCAAQLLETAIIVEDRIHSD